MRIESEITDRGYFFLINIADSSMKFKGTLQIKDGGRGYISLDVSDASIFKSYIGKSFTLGAELVEHKLCIISDCLITSLPFENGEVKVSTGNLLLQLGYGLFQNLNLILNESNNPKLNGVIFSFDHLNRWAASSESFELNKGENHQDQITIIFQPRESIHLYSDDKFEINLVFFYKHSSFPISDSEFRIIEIPYIEILGRNNQKFDLSVIHREVYKFLTFMYFIIGRPISINKSRAIIFDDQSRKYYSDLIYRTSPYLKEVENISKQDMTLTAQYLINNKIIFENWMNNFEILLPSISLYISYQTIKDTLVENTFLWNAQALEAFHRRTRLGSTQVSSEEYDTMSKSLKEVCPAEYLEWLDNKLKYGNEMTFGKRILELLKEFNNSLQLGYTNTNLKTLQKDIVKYRNHLTHYDISNRPVDLDIALKMITLTKVMEATLIFHLFKFIGLDEEIIGRVLNHPFKKVSNIINQAKYQLEVYYKITP